jgi:hypothetical protein
MIINRLLRSVCALDFKSQTARAARRQSVDGRHIPIAALVSWTHDSLLVIKSAINCCGSFPGIAYFLLLY